jgi:hypothetical protein
VARCTFNLRDAPGESWWICDQPARWRISYGCFEGHSAENLACVDCVALLRAECYAGTMMCYMCLNPHPCRILGVIDMSEVPDD